MGKYVLSPQSQKSLEDIRDYTFTNFGQQQTKLYLQGLRQKMRHLAKHPIDGKQRDEVKVGYRCASIRSHTIFYRVRDTHIDIIDILHQSMEPSLHI